MAKKKKRSTGNRQAEPKPQINVRFQDQDLYDLIVKDAADGERKNPAQVRLILRKHYAKQLAKKKRKGRK